MKFTKLTEAEQAEFLELTKDCLDPELYSEEHLPMLRALKKKWEEHPVEEPPEALDSSSRRRTGDLRRLERAFSLGLSLRLWPE
jgi:hypothetical protein